MRGNSIIIFMSSFYQDFRLTLRMLCKAPGYTLIILLVLGSCIGANTAIFSLANAVLLRPLPYPRSERLIVARQTAPGIPTGSVSLPNYLDWRGAQRSFTDLALSRFNRANLVFDLHGGAPPERARVAEVAANFLTVLQITPKIGRDFMPEEDTPGGPKVAIISDELWQTRYHGDLHVIGQRIEVDGVPREIVGVLPPGIDHPHACQVYVPLGDLRVRPEINARENKLGWIALGRLKDGVTLAQAQADLDGIAAELARRYPESNVNHGIRAESLLHFQVGHYEGSLGLLLAGVTCVLLIACANVASLQLARALGRARELAIRAALGASRGRLVRQLLTESLLLSLLGGVIGALLALWLVDAVSAFAPHEVTRFHEARLDGLALGFTFVVTLVVGLVVGGWPAWRVSSRATITASLQQGNTRGGSSGAGQSRARAILIVTQIALAVLLLSCAGLALQSFARAEAKPLGFQPDRLLTLSLSLPEARYEGEKAALFFAQLLERVLSLPGVEAAAVGNNIPFGELSMGNSFHVTGTPPVPRGQEAHAELNYVSPGYNRALGVAMRSGQEFTPTDGKGSERPVIIDQVLADRYFPNQDPLGQHIDDASTIEAHAPPLTVIGVAAHVRYHAPGEAISDELPQMQLPAAQVALTQSDLLVRVRSGNPTSLVASIRQIVKQLDPSVPLANVNTMEDSVARSMGAQRLVTTLLGAFAAFALVLASLGLYGVLALSVNQRTRELGIRLALGAPRRALMCLVIRHGMTLTCTGLLVGLVAALASGQLLASVLYGVGGSEPQVLGSVIAGLTLVSLAACWLPAKRAMSVDPLVALRNE